MSHRVFGEVGAVSVQRCAACGIEYDELAAFATCESCGGLLDILHGAPRVDASGLRAGFDDASMGGSAPGAAMVDRTGLKHSGSQSGVWRYRSIVMPSAGNAIVSHPEGNTALIVRASVSAWSGCDGLLMKHEGHNPTGSFKDRGMTVAMTQASRIGSAAVACASTGNTSASLAAYAAQAGIPALVFVPSGQVALGKLTQTLAYGARTLIVRGNFDECLRLVQESARQLGVYLVNSINPWRVEGQKTIVLEMLHQLGWNAPDFIVLPAGNLGNTSAFGKALREAHALGLIDRMPRLVAVQAQGAAPFARSFAERFAHRYRVNAETVATAIRIGDPASHDRAVRAIEETSGLVLSCSDEEILDAKMVIDASGVGCEPASAASVAGVRKLVDSGIIQRDDQVVAVLTGHVLKDPGVLQLLHEKDDRPRSNKPIEIDASLSAIERVIAQARS